MDGLPGNKSEDLSCVLAFFSGSVGKGKVCPIIVS